MEIIFTLDGKLTRVSGKTLKQICTKVSHYIGHEIEPKRVVAKGLTKECYDVLTSYKTIMAKDIQRI